MIKNNVKKDIVSLKEQIELLNNMKKEIEIGRKNFSSSKEKFKKIVPEFRAMQEKKITLSVGELINELSSLTGIEPSNIGVEIDTNVAYWAKLNEEEFIEMMNSSEQYLSYTGNYSKNNYLTINIFADKNLPYFNNKQLFCYQLKRRFDLEEIQSDGKSLLEHCSIKQRYEDFQGLYTTKLIVDKDIEGLNIDLNLYKLMQEDARFVFVDRWYPTNLIRQAAINSFDKNNEKQETDLHKVKIKK